MSRLMGIALSALTMFFFSSCQRGVNVPVQINAPPNATDLRVDVNADSSSHELVFVVPSERDGYSLVNQIENQMTKAGYTRCTAGGGQWETLKHRGDARVMEERRLLRFFKTSDPRQLAMILVRQDCKQGESQCQHQFIVRQIDVPKSIPGAEKYVRDICENRSQIADPGTGLQFR